LDQIVFEAEDPAGSLTNHGEGLFGEVIQVVAVCETDGELRSIGGELRVGQSAQGGGVGGDPIGAGEEELKGGSGATGVGRALGFGSDPADDPGLDGGRSGGRGHGRDGGGVEAEWRSTDLAMAPGRQIIGSMGI
jgi:hypothetical protein